MPRLVFRVKLLVLARVGIFGKHFWHISADHPTGKFPKMIRKGRLPPDFLGGEGRVQDRMMYRMFPHKGHHEIEVLSQVSNLLNSLLLTPQVLQSLIWVVVSNIVYFHPYLWRWWYLTNIFQWIETTNQLIYVCVCVESLLLNRRG